MTAPKRENVAIFNPLVLPLPNWHPDGPDGAIDGFVIPFVMPGKADPMNRRARVTVLPGAHGWRAELSQCQTHAETPEQARAFAGAWIRAAELLDNAAKRAAGVEPLGDDHVVDAEVVDDEPEPEAPARATCPACQQGSCTLHAASTFGVPSFDNGDDL